jgi:Ca-activated chloride channel family protein
MMVLVLAAIAVRPAFGHSRQPAQLSNLDVFFVVDTTPSAAAEDYDGHQPRLVGMRADIKAIAASLSGARFTLVTFANATDIRVPLTTDPTALDTAVDLVNPYDSLYSDGSGIDEPVSAVTKQLAEAKAEQPERTRIVIYLGDGEQTARRPVGSFAPWAPYVSGGAVLGYGSTAGGRMRYYSTGTGPTKDYVTGPDGLPAASKYAPQTLQAAASQIAVPFTHRTAPGPVRASLRVPRTRPAGSGGAGGQRAGETYWIFAIALGLLAATELAGVGRRARPVWRAA